MEPLVEEILFARAQQEHEFELYIQEEMQKMPACEIPAHHDGTEPQFHAGEARWILVTRHKYRYACEKFRQSVMECGGIICDCAQGKHLLPELTFIPLDLEA